MDGQLGSGRLIDFALTSGRPAGPWHAYRLMSPFTCKFKEIMRASPRKFTQKRRRHPQYGGSSSRRDGRSSESPCTFLLGSTRPGDLSFISMVQPKSLGVHLLCPLNRRKR
ncbi:Protein adenylyltransferase SelO mitochondrial [Dissostichus eleginoides]|uniref:Protein adenylyltransferase SelO mitochondrial n=1 Tax=Dissostichus eleginoides TaxID=100907 RepID=A0AAD9FLN4_DISEL|nr:Protein adenylyltransferase SelO mitochondrial [Dissostichus eleginoides]